jgi:hypothetical protein
MNVQKTIDRSKQISQEKLLAAVRAVAGRTQGREDDDHPLPPGPWDPVIRTALERVISFGPLPDPWVRSSELVRLILTLVIKLRPELSDALKPHSVIDLVGLNPQPLPPRAAFLAALARTVVERAELMQEIADAQGRGEQQGIIIVGGYPTRFADELCPEKFRFKWPFPHPPHPWFKQELDGVDLLMLATEFGQAAKEAFSPALRQGLAAASAKFAETGLSRMQ